MLHNAYLVANIGADTTENEQHLPKFCNLPVPICLPVNHSGDRPSSEAVEPSVFSRQPAEPAAVPCSRRTGSRTSYRRSARAASAEARLFLLA